jgi:hypothetical protein
MVSPKFPLHCTIDNVVAGLKERMANLIGSNITVDTVMEIETTPNCRAQFLYHISNRCSGRTNTAYESYGTTITIDE